MSDMRGQYSVDERHLAKLRALEGRRATAGLTLLELMVTALIVVLVSGVVALGVAFATKSYANIMTRSESRELCSTLASVVSNEMQYTSKIKLSGNTVVGFKSVEFPEVQNSGYEWAKLVVENGELKVVGYNTDGSTGEKLELLPSSTYGDSARRLSAAVEVSYYSTPAPRGHYHVLLQVYNSTGVEQARSEFDVIPANAPQTA